MRELPLPPPGHSRVVAIKCPLCRCTIYSRARHDLHYCACGAYSVDGGFDYFRCAWKPTFPQPVPIVITVPETRVGLYADWNVGANEFGTIGPDGQPLSYGPHEGIVKPAATNARRTRASRTRRAPSSNRKRPTPRRKNPRNGG